MLVDRSRNWTGEKWRAAAQGRQALEEKSVKAPFAFIGFSEATSSPCRPELDNRKVEATVHRRTDWDWWHW
ncbi:hypothetical protein [Siminovitchia fortis]|uniref:hypothetical protein n=1 Tax=Siminovitchia fortis TaxID=254758 RepID=UPI0011A2A173|nr:hypothetical protein [Siminovitchia fortis]